MQPGPGGYGPYGPPGYGPTQGYPPGHGPPPPRKPSSTTVVLGIVVGVVVVFAIVGAISDRNGSSRRGASGTDEPAESTALGSPDSPSSAAPTAIELDAKTLIKAYEGNEIDADDAYKGRVAVVSGKVDSIGKDILDDAYITVGTGAAFELPTVQCMLADAGDAKGLKKGQQVRVRGEVRGLMMNVLLDECVVVVR